MADPSTDPSQDIADYLEWLRLSGQSVNTLKSYRTTLGWLLHWLEDRGIALREATTAQLTGWRTDLSAGRHRRPSDRGPRPRPVCDASVIAYMAPVRGFYEWARRGGRVQADPARDVPIPRRPRRLPRPISENDLERAIREAPDRIRCWLVLAGYLGLRACEIAGLTREDITHANGRRFLRVTGKGGKQRLLLISPYVWEELAAARLPGRGPLFTRADGRPGPNTPSRISEVANAYLRSVGIGETLHQLRHRFGTTAHEAVGDLRVVQEAMGHASPETTAGYTAYSDPRLQEAVLAVQPESYRRTAHRVTPTPRRARRGARRCRGGPAG